MSTATDETRGERRKIERRLYAFIVTELVEEEYRGTDPLADQAVDSLGVEQLVEYIDETFRIELRDEEIVEANFESLAALAALVEARASATPSAAGPRP